MTREIDIKKLFISNIAEAKFQLLVFKPLIAPITFTKKEKVVIKQVTASENAHIIQRAIVINYI